MLLRDHIERQELVPRELLSLLNVQEAPCVASYNYLNKVSLGIRNWVFLLRWSHAFIRFSKGTCPWACSSPWSSHISQREGLQKEGLEPLLPHLLPFTPLMVSEKSCPADTPGRRGGREGGRGSPALFEQFWSSRKHSQFINIHLVSKEFRFIQSLGGSKM